MTCVNSPGFAAWQTANTWCRHVRKFTNRFNCLLNLYYVSEPSMSKSSMSKLTQSTIWKTLEEHFNEISPLHMRDMFDEDPQRFDKFSLTLNDILFDYSKKQNHD